MQAMASTNEIMGKTNEEMDVKAIGDMMKTFQKESMKSEMKMEFMQDAMEMDDTGEEADDVYNQILGEIGMQMDTETNVAVGTIASKNQVPAPVMEEQKDDQVDDLEARLAALGS